MAQPDGRAALLLLTNSFQSQIDDLVEQFRSLFAQLAADGNRVWEHEELTALRQKPVAAPSPLSPPRTGTARWRTS